MAENTVVFGFFTYLSIIIISSCIFVVYIYSLRKTSELNYLKRIILKKRIEPHFIFNTIASIQYLILSNKTDLADRYLSQFGLMLRDSIELSEKEWIPLEKEIEYIKRYIQLICLNKEISIELKIVYNITSDRELRIPPFILLPAVDNSLIHGFRGNSKPNKYIRIIINEYLTYVECIVEDNGNGISRSEELKNELTHKATGIKTINKRIRAINRKINPVNLYSIKINDQDNTIAIIKIPLNSEV